jgi:hypothetical protein
VESAVRAGRLRSKLISGAVCKRSMVNELFVEASAIMTSIVLRLLRVSKSSEKSPS